MSPLLPFPKGSLAVPEPLERKDGLCRLVERGRLHEAIPARPGAEIASLGFLTGLAKQWPAKSMLWVREQSAASETGEIYAPGLHAFGLDPASLILVHARKRDDAMWAAEQGLRVDNMIVLLELSGRDKPIDLTATRRFGLACEKFQSTALVLRGDIIKTPTMPSAAWTRWHIAPAPSASDTFDEVGAPTFDARLLRHRAGPAGARFALEWNCDDHVFAERPQKVGGDLATPPVDRSDHARRFA